MANYGPPGGNFGAPQNYGNFPGAPYMGPPPGTGGAPGMSPPPGMASAQSPLPARPNGIPPQFQPPANFGNINFNAPVIRMGVPQPGKTPTPYGGFDDRKGGGDAGGGSRGRLGLGADSGRQPRAEPLNPLTKEEVARTVFVTGLIKGTPDDVELEELLGIGRGLRRWHRCMDADEKACQFGFAEYEDAPSLEIATKLFQDIELPLKEKGRIIKEEDDNIKKAKLLVNVDPESLKYIQQWSKPNEDDFQFRLDTAKEDLSTLLAQMSNTAATNGNGTLDMNGEVKLENGAQGENAEVITIAMGAADDELSDIPEEMRESVRVEIKAFRDRSTRRDLERLRKEEEMSNAEKERSIAASRPSRLASPPLSAPTGPGGANSIPVGPRGRVVEGAPSGPKAYRGVQMPKDYVDGVNFTTEGYEDSTDDSASDTEIDRRRVAKRDEDLEKRYLEQKRRWIQKEKTHFAAAERQQKEEAAAEANKERHRAELAERLKTFDDDAEKRNPTHPYYKDRRAWVKHRRVVRFEEKRSDDKDRRAEERELDAVRRRQNHDGMDVDTDIRRETDRPQRNGASQPAARQAFSLNLGGFGGLGASKVDGEDAANKASKQSVADMEGLLDDEEEEIAGPGAGVRDRKALHTADFKPLAAGEKMNDEERRTAMRQLAGSIPQGRRDLFAWPIKWDHVSDSFITSELRPYVQKKILEALGVQEDLLVEVIESIVRNRGSPDEIMKELEVLDEEAEDLTMKVWRAVVLGSEREARGLSTNTDDA